MRGKQRALLITAIVGVGCALVLAAGYFYIKSGGLVARRKPSALETFVAQRLVDLSVPKESSIARNPLDPTSANADAGRELYRKNCEVCHASDGKGKTAAGLGTY